MTTILPIDANDNPIPALRLRGDKGHVINASTGSAIRNSTAFLDDTKIVSVYATGAVYLMFGDISINAVTGVHYFPEGVYYDFAIGGYGVDHTPYLSVLAADEDCTVYISEKV